MDVSLEVHAVQLDLCFHASDFNITEISMIFCVCDQLKGLAEWSEMEKKAGEADLTDLNDMCQRVAQSLE